MDRHTLASQCSQCEENKGSALALGMAVATRAGEMATEADTRQTASLIPYLGLLTK